MKIGIIGGSGLYDLEGLHDVARETVDTPFGAPSDAYVRGVLAGREIHFLPRHGVGHRLMPSELNHRANIFGFKLLGVERIISISAVGSLKENMRPRDIVLPDQYFDRTKTSANHTFFGGGLVAHVAFGEPTCPALRKTVRDVARETVAGKGRGCGTRVHCGGTYVNMEGPAFSTKAESSVYRRFGFDVIGMTSLAEAKLCREAEICYQPVAMVTDYDCWHAEEAEVSVEMLIGHLRANTALAREILQGVVRALPESRDCACGAALRSAIITDPAVVPDELRRRMAPLVGKYLP
ncbi:MAG: S-methyl-5'-thioadenosine phosphorylase [Lentisphaerae bacterium]|nr:S-methyl-5'-thioadenosine phosphorylase [Lentisphaerota bacterium]